MRWWPYLLIAVALLLPGLAQGAHEHDHRYVVVGRVLDGDGLPVGGAAVRAELVGSEPTVPAQVPKTNCLGDFIAVFSVEDVDEATVEVTLNAVERSRAADTELRRTFFGLHVPGAASEDRCQEARENFTRQQVITGRLIVPPGQPAQNTRVNVTVELADGDELTRQARTNQAGDFAIGFQSARFSEGDRVVVQGLGETWSQPLNVTWGITVADHVQRLPEASEDGRWVIAGVVVTLALGGLVFVLWQRRPT